jgi:arabinan endo-1,5-alpha-L-arabinosidase
MMALHDDDGELNGQFRLALVPLEWDDGGWPELR